MDEKIQKFEVEENFKYFFDDSCLKFSVIENDPQKIPLMLQSVPGGSVFDIFTIFYLKFFVESENDPRNVLLWHSVHTKEWNA